MNKQTIIIIFIIFVCVSGVFADQLNQESQYSSAQKLYNEINNLKWHHNNLSKYDEVITKCKVTIQQNPNTEIALKAQELIIQSYEKQAEYSKKDQAFDKYIEMIEQIQGTDKAAEKIIETGNAYFNKGYFEAKLYYEKLLKKYPTHKKASYVHRRIAECYDNSQINSHAKAITEYRKIIQLFPEEKSTQDVYLKLAGLFTKERKFAEAIDTLNMLLNKFSQSDLIPTARFYLGYFYYQNGNHSEAKKTFEEFLKDYPSCSFANLAKGFLRSLTKLSTREDSLPPTHREHR